MHGCVSGGGAHVLVQFRQGCGGEAVSRVTVLPWEQQRLSVKGSEAVAGVIYSALPSSKGMSW